MCSHHVQGSFSSSSDPSTPCSFEIGAKCTRNVAGPEHLVLRTRRHESSTPGAPGEARIPVSVPSKIIKPLLKIHDILRQSVRTPAILSLRQASSKLRERQLGEPPPDQHPRGREGADLSGRGQRGGWGLGANRISRTVILFSTRRINKNNDNEIMSSLCNKPLRAIDFKRKCKP